MRRSVSLEAVRRFSRIALRKNIPVYSDLIWGLPGESYSDFVNGVEKIFDIGILGTFVFPLEVIPGTRFYEQRKDFGFKILASSDHGGLVVAHPKMSVNDHRKGMLFIHAHHLLFSLKTCHFVHRCLKLMFGITHGELCESFLRYVGPDHKPVLSDEAELLRRGFFKAFASAAEFHGANAVESINSVVYGFWDHWEAAGELFADFHREVLSSIGAGPSAEQWAQIQEMIRFNVLVAYKPGCFYKKTASFDYDVGSFYREVMRRWAAGKSAAGLPKLEKRACSYIFTQPVTFRPNMAGSFWRRMAPTCGFEETQGRASHAADAAADLGQGKILCR